jgi:hypothetical protein
MNTKSLGGMVVILVILGGLFYITNVTGRISSERSQEFLFEDIDSSKIAQLRIEQGDEIREVVIKDGVWTLPDKHHYRANQSKVKQILFQLLGLEVSQLVTRDEQNYAELGVTEEAIVEGNARVIFKDKDGKEISGVIIGNQRKREDPSGMPLPTGQYIRRTDKADVYLVGQMITVTASLSGWIDASLVNIPPRSIYSITQSSINKDDVIDFKLLRDESDEDARFIPDIQLASGEQIKNASINALRTGLENLRIDNVYGQRDDISKEVNFDKQVTYALTNGEQYEILSAVSDDKQYIKINVSFNEDLANRIKSEAEQMHAKQMAEKPKDIDVSEIDAEAEVGVIEKPDIKLSSFEEASKVNIKFDGWIFEVPKHIGDKFRSTRSDLIEISEDKGD